MSDRRALASNPSPEISVLLAVHNGERYLEASLRSIMEQTYSDIEIIVVDDASTDRTPDILNRLSAEDHRIRTLRLKENVRLTRALNYGLELVRAPLVARMDADDISMPHRLAVQKTFLDEHPEITLIGSSVETIDSSGRSIRRTFRPRDSFSIRWLARFAPGIPHPSFMFRTSGPDGNPLRYNSEFSVAQDYEFICRLLAHGLNITCLPDILVRYRRHNSAISSQKAYEQRSAARLIATAFQKEDLPAELFDIMSVWRALHFGGERATPERIARLFSIARKILDYDCKKYPDRTLWIHRQTSQLLILTLQRSGMPRQDILKSFLYHGLDFVPPAIFRAMEINRLLPRRLRSDPLVKSYRQDE